ncbi:unnamed protein product [Rangifer tarandus platyrhynchus]|uniref:Uncharacterized protein n=2 Tax=Rangifer tarandus platyrhynchus TaxID=3082113 RepID=A0ABN8Z505_RANTA|nr:unnamed protein product [Rangifer tarandus platyrhynchus]CAI9704048.1 unnamed protein product [Rangifer tarandus platyrhynchus]
MVGAAAASGNLHRWPLATPDPGAAPPAGLRPPPRLEGPCAPAAKRLRELVASEQALVGGPVTHSRVVGRRERFPWSFGEETVGWAYTSPPWPPP